MCSNNRYLKDFFFLKRLKYVPTYTIVFMCYCNYHRLENIILEINRNI